MHKSNQNGFVHGVLILFVVIIFAGLLSFVFWSGFIKNQSLNNENDEKALTGLKDFISVTGSGLHFTYPTAWSLNLSSDDSNERSDRKTSTYLLTSQPLSVVNSKPQIASDSMCVTISELKGNHQFQSKVPESYYPIEDIMIGSSKVSLLASEGDANSSEMRLASVLPVSEHGSNYVALKDGYYLVAVAQANCYPGDNQVKRDITNDILEAKSILKSVHIVGE